MIIEPLGIKDFAFSLFTSAPTAAEAGKSSALAGAGVAERLIVAEARSILSTPVAQAAESAPQAPAEVAQSNLSREAMQRRQDELARKEQDLRTLEKDLDDRLVRLQELEMRLKAMLKEAEEIKSAKYRHLVDVLSNMKAKQAASVLETLDEKVAVKVLAGMRGRQAGEILTFVNSAKAARLSEALARVQMPFE